MLWIISGASSVGKSSYIQQQQSRQNGEAASRAGVFFPDDLSLIDSATDRTGYLHYNILRPIHILHSDLMDERSPLLSERARPSFGEDPAWLSVLDWPGEKRAVVLLTSRQTLLNRIQTRAVIEPRDLTRQPEQAYPVKEWENIATNVDLRRFYLEWLRELEAHGIPYDVIDSTNRAYSRIPNIDALLPAGPT